MLEPTTVVIGFWDIVLAAGALVTVFAGVAWAFGTQLVSQFKAHLDERFMVRDEKLQGFGEDIRKLEIDVATLRLALPNEYVRREDWIRFSNTIDHKLDRLNEKGEATRDAMANMAASLVARLGDGHGR